MSHREQDGNLSPRDDRELHTIDAKRRATLKALDEAKFSRFHLKIILVAGVGFFTDAYDLFAITIVIRMLGIVYGTHYDPVFGSSLTPRQELALKVASPVGTIFGQVIFGWLADFVGRKRMYGIELIIIIASTFIQALSGQGYFASIVGVLFIYRLLMGIGIGGDYPLSAVICSEFAPIKIRGRLMSAVVASQGWGQFFAAIVSVAVVSGLKGKLNQESLMDPRDVDLCWRLIIGLGCVPATIALYFRFTIPEVPRFTMDVERNVKQASRDAHTFLTFGTFVVDPDAVVNRAVAPRATRRDFRKYFGEWKNAKILLGAGYSWFAIDIIFYGLGLNNDRILCALGYGPGGPPQNLSNCLLNVTWDSRSDIRQNFSLYTSLRNDAIGNIILLAAGLIPGYYATTLFIDKWGRKPIQLLGFTMLTIIFIFMGSLLPTHPHAIYLFCLANFFQNFGPNATTFIIPGEAFPTRYRATAHGLSAASGKLGAIVSQVMIYFIGGPPDQKFRRVLFCFSAFAFSGILSTLPIPETKRRSLEDISNENQENFIRGVPGIPLSLTVQREIVPPLRRAHTFH